MMANCSICQGLIMEANKSYGYAGKVCQCGLSSYVRAPATDQKSILPDYKFPHNIKSEIAMMLADSGIENPYYMMDLFEKLILQLAQIETREYGE